MSLIGPMSPMRKRISTARQLSPLHRGAQFLRSALSFLKHALLLQISGESFYEAAEEHHLSALRRISRAHQYVGDIMNYVPDPMHYVADLVHSIRDIIHYVRDIMSPTFFLPGHVRFLLHCSADIVHFRKNIVHCVRDIMHWVPDMIHYVADMMKNGSFQPVVTF